MKVNVLFKNGKFLTENLGKDVTKETVNQLKELIATVYSSDRTGHFTVNDTIINVKETAYIKFI